MNSDHPGSTTDDLWALVQAAAAGDRAAWEALWGRHHRRLCRMIDLRLDVRLRGRVDPSDVLQEAWIEAAKRLADYAASDQPMPFALWLRFLVGQQLLVVHRRHFAAGRDPRRERPIDRGGAPEVSSEVLALELAGSDTRPSEAAERDERRRGIQEALERLDPVDREVLALRHFEQFSNAECARALGLTESGATRRYLRALERLTGGLRSGPLRSGGREP